MLPGLFQGKTKKRRVKVPEALEYLTQEEEQKLIDMDSVARTAVERVEQAGIIFIDEIDKIAGREGGHGPDVSREGVQRDILPIVEGTTVNTKYGMVRTDHILFIAAGAFHVSKPSDLIPELQGRFPIRVELEALGQDEFVRILTEPRSALVKQYMALMETEGIDLTFTDDAIHRIADFATHRERADREHRRAPAAHGDGEAARRDLVRRARPRRNKRVTIDDAYVDADARRHRQERRPVAVHSVSARRYNAEHRRARRDDSCFSAISAMLCVDRRRGRCSACGKKGPPLPPLVKLPVAPPDLTAERRGDDVDLQFTVPRQHRRTRPANVERVDVYAITARAPTMTDARSLKQGTKVASVAVKAPRDPDDDRRAGRAGGGSRAAGGQGPRSGRCRDRSEQLTASMLPMTLAAASRSDRGR